MKYLFVSILLFVSVTDPLKISKINRVKKEAREAYTSADYKTAVAKYKYLIDSLQVNEDEITINLANSYFHLKDTTNALSSYQSLAGSLNSEIRSKAHQQMGIMNHQQNKLEEALNNFKQAIKADPHNTSARYDYEMLKKKLEEKKKQEEQQQKDQQNKDQQKDQQNKDQKQNKDQQQKDQQKKDQEKKDQEKKDQEQKDQQNKEDQQKKDQQQKDQQQKDKEEKEKKEQQQKEQQQQDQKENKDQEKKDIPPQVAEKLKQMKISPDKAKMILEAMKNQEVQYLQQNKRKATKARDKGKPDW